MHAQTVINPEIGKTYFVIHSSGNFLTESSGYLLIDKPTATKKQLFKFIPVVGNAGVYNIQVSSATGYLCKSSNSLLLIGTDPGIDFAKFAIENNGDSIKLKCSDGKYLGTDVVAAGSVVYSDKNGSDPISHWFLVEAVENQIIVLSLNNSIVKAQNTLSSAVVGSDGGQYAQSDCDVFTNAIAAANSVLSSAASQTEINNATIALINATTTFISSANINLPKAYKNFLIKHSGGFYMTEANGSMKIDNLSNTNNQYFKFIPVAGSTDVYNIMICSTGGYITKKGGWEVTIGTDSSANIARFNMEVVPGTTTTLKFKCLDNNRYLGTDASTAGSLIYSDKSGTDVKHYWSAIEVRQDGLMLDSLNLAITNALTIKTAAVPGVEIGQYPQSAFNTFTAAITVANNVVANPTSQSAVDAATVTLVAATSSFTESVIKSISYANNTYYIVHSSGLYITEASGGVKINSATNSANQQFLFIPVAGSADVYNLQVVSTGAFIAKTGTWNVTLGTDPTANVAKFKFEVVSGTTSTIKIKCLDNNFYLGTDATITSSLIYSNKSGTDTKHYWSFKLFKQALNTDALSSSISAATTLKSGAIVGTLPGQYPQVAYDAFCVQIAHATSIKVNTLITQFTVDSMVLILNNAIPAFEVSVILSNTTALKTIIDNAQADYMNAVVGNYDGAYTDSAKQSLASAISGANAVYTNSSAKQSDIDNATTSLSASLSTFKTLSVKVDKTLLFNEIGNMNTFKTSIISGTYTQESLDIFTTALGSAQSVYNDIFATQVDVNVILADLKSSMDGLTFTRIVSIYDNSIFAYTANSTIYLIGLVESSKITICNLVGQIISSTTYNGNVFNRVLASGNYIVSIVSQNHRKSMVVIVK